MFVQTFRYFNGSSARRAYIAAGIFIFVLAAYALSSPGRIDIVDGQARYDVTYHWIVTGRPVFTDPWLRFMSVRGPDGLPYSPYGAAASVVAMPLVRLGLLVDTPAHETSRFLFSLTCAIFGAGVAVVLFLFYLELGISLSSAVLWTLVSALATLMWPASTSTFDNAQHAFFLIGSVFLGYVAGRRSSRWLAALAGLTAAVLIVYQEYFLMLIPALALSVVQWTGSRGSNSAATGLKPGEQTNGREGSTLLRDCKTLLGLIRSGIRTPGDARESLARFLIYCSVSIVAGVALSLAFNYFRFGTVWETGKHVLGSRGGLPPLFGNPLAGLGTLLISPGKSVFLYSPPAVLAIIGMRYLRRNSPPIAFAAIGAAFILVGFISCIAFAGGDWCWGPRYLVPLLPLWALAFPFLFRAGVIRRDVILAIVGLGLV